jgi:hypothetical protein
MTIAKRLALHSMLGIKMKPLFGLTVSGLLALATPSAHATLVYDSMFQASVPGWPTDPLNGGDGPVLAASFSTGAGGVLRALHLLLQPGGDAAGSSGAFLVSVAPDLGGTPDLNPLDAVWSSGSISDSAFADTGNGYWNLGFAPIPGNVALADSTRYWVVLASDSSNPTSLMGWVFAGDDSGTGVAGEGWYIQCPLCDPSPMTGPNETGPYVMSVDIAQVPEPMTLGILGLGLAGLGIVRCRPRTRA